MKVILKEDIKGKGKKGDIIEVSDSYGRNVIISKGLGVEATKENLNSLKLKKANDEKVAKELYEKALKDKELLEKSSIDLKIKVGKNGQVFGAISNKDVGEAIKKQLKLDIDKKKIVVNDKIKNLGVNRVASIKVDIKLHTKVNAILNVNIMAE